MKVNKSKQTNVVGEFTFEVFPSLEKKQAADFEAAW